MMLAKLRQSATVIIAARTTSEGLKSLLNFDYQVLMVNRPDKGSFSQNCVFPGGVHEINDESVQWLKLLKNFGVKNEKLHELSAVKEPRPQVFNSVNINCIQKQISLRITALRETFEEVGLLFYRSNHLFRNSTQDNASSFLHENFDKDVWQKKVHKDPGQFLKLFEEFNIIPDLWCLNEWSIWISPYHKKNRFHAIFYLIVLDSGVPELALDFKELVGFFWNTPKQFLDERAQKKILLPPPQFYELARLCNFSRLDELQTFAYNRSKNYGMNELLPVMYKCANGELSVLPEDELYPENPLGVETIDSTKVTIEELNTKTNRHHRMQWKNGNLQNIFINVKLCDGQLNPKLP